MVQPKKSSTPLHRKRATTVNTSFSSDNATPQPSTSAQYPKKTDTLAAFEAKVIDDLSTAVSAMKTSTPNAAADGAADKETGARKKDDARYCISLFAENPIKLKELHIAENDGSETLAQPLPSTSNAHQQMGAAEPPTLSAMLSPDHVKKQAAPKPIDSESFIIGQLLRHATHRFQFFKLTSLCDNRI